MLIIFTIGYLTIFSIVSVLNQRYSFLFSAGLMLIFTFLALYLYKKAGLPISAMTAMTLIAALHIFAGNTYIYGARLYDIWLIDKYLKFDNLVHFLGGFVAVYIIFILLEPYLDSKIKERKFVFSVLLILIAAGIGTINEILELGAVLFLNASTLVGDYFNNAFDLLYNFLGATTAGLLAIGMKKGRVNN